MTKSVDVKKEYEVRGEELVLRTMLRQIRFAKTDEDAEEIGDALIEFVRIFGEGQFNAGMSTITPRRFDY